MANERFASIVKCPISNQHRGRLRDNNKLEGKQLKRTFTIRRRVVNASFVAKGAATSH